MAEEEKPADVLTEDEPNSKPEDDVAALKETAKEKLAMNGGESTEDSLMSNGHEEGENGTESENGNGNGHGKSSEANTEDESDEIEAMEADDDVIEESGSQTNSEEPEEVDADDVEAEELEAEEIVEDVEDDEDDDDEVQEVKDDSSDSDVMEVEAEDPLEASSEDAVEATEAKITSSLTSTEVKKPQVVTIDDPKQLQALASSAAKSKAERDKVTVIDTSAILAGRSTSGVTITPATKPQPKKSEAAASLPASLASSLAASGVTISSKSSPLASKSASASVSKNASPAASKSASPSPAPSSAFTYDAKGQLKDPNLTDDTIVIEAPSFIVPYVYEKPPKETFEGFKADIKKLMDDLKKVAEKDEKAAEAEAKAKAEAKKAKKEAKKAAKAKRKRKTSGSGQEDNGEREDDDDYSADSDSADNDSDDSDIMEVAKRSESPELPDVQKPNENYFESTLGKMVSNLGMNLVQECVQIDLLKQQQKKARKEKSAAVMHAIMSLKQNIEQSKENNSQFHFEQLKCRFCSFRTESQMVLEHHLETPHMRHGLYRYVMILLNR